MKNNWQTKKLSEVCNVDYGTRVVRSRNISGDFYVYGGGGKTFTSNEYNREDCVIVSRFAMSPYCVRKILGKFFLNRRQKMCSQNLFPFQVFCASPLFRSQQILLLACLYFWF